MVRFAWVVVAVAVLVVGCSPGATQGGPIMNPDKPTITKAQALKRVEELIRDTTGALHPKPNLELYPPSVNDHRCLDPTDGGSEDRIEVGREYYLRDVPKDQLRAVLEQVKTYWLKQGHLVDADGIDKLVLYGRSRPDDYPMSVTWSGNDVLAIGVGSPCIWPDGTPPPTPGA